MFFFQKKNVMDKHILQGVPKTNNQVQIWKQRTKNGDVGAIFVDMGPKTSYKWALVRVKN